LEEKFHEAYNQRCLVVTNVAAKGAHRIQRENINRPLLEQGQTLMERNMKKVILLILTFALSFTPDVAIAGFTLGEPVNLGSPVNTNRSDGTPCISPDGLSLYFTSNRPGSRSHDLWVVTRSSKEESWSSPTNLGTRVNSSSMDYFPSISADGLSVYFYSARGGGRGGGDIWVSSRTSTDSPWDYAVNLGSAVNSSAEDVSPNVSADGLSLMFASNRGGGHGSYDLYICTRTSHDAPWSAAVNLSPVINSAYLDVAPSLSPDGLTLFFHSIRSSGYGTYDLYYSRRQSLDSQWSDPVNIGPPVNSSYSELGPSISGDGRYLYWSDSYLNPPRPGGFGIDDIWQVSIDPVLDLNSDGVVDSADMCIIVDNWHTENTLCDIAPPPLGDGFVDVKDLIVLAEHLFDDCRALSQWKLDEKTGDIAYDSVGGQDGTLFGEPVWQPIGGRVVGALQLDGIDDYVGTPFVLDPAKGSLSAFAWIKGGSPGQVILSQTGDFGGTWLSINPSQDTLMTGFSGMYFGDLISETVITNGLWHHVGFVYDTDTFHRRLYVDGVLVAEDATVVSGMPSDGGLYIGASKELESASFFSGFIDDVRIYNQALSAEEIAALAK
jgi:Tol biopolymer transport system component